MCIGILFGISADRAHSRPSTIGVDLPELVSQRQGELKEKERAVQKLHAQVDDLIDAASPSTGLTISQPIFMQTVSGPGLRVVLDDAPADAIVDDRIDVNALVVHQQDVDAVMNALWSGGAEAMTVQGIRISPTTPVRCIGNVILVGGTAFAPPYRIEAIGNPDTLSFAVSSDPQVNIYMQYVTQFGLGWSTEVLNQVTFPHLDEGHSVQYARPKKDTAESN